MNTVSPASNFKLTHSDLSNVGKNLDIYKAYLVKGLIVVFSSEKKDSMEYIGHHLLKNITNVSSEDKEEDVFININEDAFVEERNLNYILLNKSQDKILKELVSDHPGFAPDIMILNDLNEYKTFNKSIISSSLPEHLLILGIEAKNKEEVITKLIDTIVSSDSFTEEEARNELNSILKVVIDIKD